MLLSQNLLWVLAIKMARNQYCRDRQVQYVARTTMQYPYSLYSWLQRYLTQSKIYQLIA